MAEDQETASSTVSSRQRNEATIFTAPVEEEKPKAKRISEWEDYQFGVNLMFKYLDISIRSNAIALFIAGGIIIYLLANDVEKTAKISALLIPLTICVLCSIYNGYSVYQAHNFTKLSETRKRLKITVGLDYLLLVRVSLLASVIHFIASLVIIRLIFLA
jgi:hypothetical protein